MPADIVTMADCASNYGVFKMPGSRGETHTVTLGGSEGGAHCTCKAWQFAAWDDKDCKHVRRLWNGGACLYNPQWKDGTANPEFRPVSYTYDAIIPGEECPACGGPMVAVRRAV